MAAITDTHPMLLFAVETGSCQLFAWAGLKVLNFASRVAGITAVSHCARHACYRIGSKQPGQFEEHMIQRQRIWTVPFVGCC
jgi:hypothetical protein